MVYLQETHFKKGSVPSLSSSRFQKAFHYTNPEAKLKGVTILIAKDLPFHVTGSKIDDNGRYVFLKGTLNSRTIPLSNVYAPNSHQSMFLSEKSDALTLFSEGTTVLGGDLNIPLCPLLNSSTGISSVPYRALKTHEGRHLQIRPA